MITWHHLFNDETFRWEVGFYDHAEWTPIKELFANKNDALRKERVLNKKERDSHILKQLGLVKHG